MSKNEIITKLIERKMEVFELRRIADDENLKSRYEGEMLGINYALDLLSRECAR